MAGYFDAPMPYIIGVRRDIWQKVKKERGGLSSFPPDVSILDIDKGAFKYKEILPDFPPTPMEKSYNALISLLSGSSDVKNQTNEDVKS